MKIALVLLSAEEQSTFAAFIADNSLTDSQITCWRVPNNNASSEAMLAALEAEYRASPVDILLFPSTMKGDELATRLAWRLKGSAVCQALAYDVAQKTVTKAVYGNGLLAALEVQRFPLCLSLSRQLPQQDGTLSLQPEESPLETVSQPRELPAPQILTKSQHPLQTAKWVLATGQGAAGDAFQQLATALGVEQGFTRQRVMAGGCDEQRMIGISGQSIAPEVCLIAGASGASAFMAGVQQSRLIVAINHDPAAPVFAAADVGIVGDAEEVLTALVQCVGQA
ncbi:MAG: electron transfer flavoprotein subunit alpha/FixB family protein [Scandinavium sp.]|uniref:electron transfer flavoprotein subunit alpha/FixB family protein n=1 Tax=Scandinavium sp. TaxID=2830653 RepID=UPI003F36D400